MTPYREPGEAPEQAISKPTGPDVEVSVGRYTRGATVLILAGAFVVTVGLAWVGYASVRISCDRRDVGARPTCVAVQAGPNAKKLGPFDLYETSLEAETRGSFDDAHTVLRTPSGDLDAAMDDAFAEKTAADAKKYLATPAERHFEAERVRASTAIGMALGGVCFALFMLVALRRTRVVVDRNVGVVRSGPGRAFSFDGISVAVKEEIDDSAFFSLVLVGRSDSDSKTIIAQGRAAEVEAAAAAINAALAEGHASTHTMPEGLRNARPGRKKIDLETFLRDLPLADLEIERDEKTKRIAAVGTSNGLPVRVEYAERKPGGTQIEVESNGVHGNFDVRLDEKLPAAFDDLPQDFARRVEEGMRRLGIRHLQVRKDGVTGRCLDAPGDVSDGRAQVSAAISLIVEVAEVFSR